MCLLIALSGVLDGMPLLVAANRDELYARPAESITVLRDHGPRILGGRDLVAGGTWLAVNSRGVVVGLTNQPSGRGRDDTRRSRGELPLAFAAYPDAATAVAKVCAELDPADYNPCWLLVGDRHSLFSVGMAGGHHPVVSQLPPGSYVLENVPLDDYSAKARQVADMVTAGIAGKSGKTRVNGANGAGAAGEAIGTNGGSRSGTPAGLSLPSDAGPPGGMNVPPGTDLPPGPDLPPVPDLLGGMNDAERALATVLRDHRHASGTGVPAAGEQVRPAELSAACVHTASYGTRSAIIVSIGDTGLPRIWVADGPPCRVPFRDVSALW